MRQSEMFVSNSTRVYYYRDFKDFERKWYPDTTCILKTHYVRFQVKNSTSIRFNTPGIRLPMISKRVSEVLENRFIYR